jgi:hypothetical protein
MQLVSFGVVAVACIMHTIHHAVCEQVDDMKDSFNSLNMQELIYIAWTTLIDTSTMGGHNTYVSQHFAIHWKHWMQFSVFT